jgi:peptide/nickel transport system substrate-binding protein
MTRLREYFTARGITTSAGVLSAALVCVGTARCSHAGPPHPENTTLRIGVGALPQLTPQAGMGQIVGGQAAEGLARTQDDGRVRPNLAENWHVAPDQLSVVVDLRPEAKFHDGTAVTSDIVAESLRSDLPDFMGAAFDDVVQIEPLDPVHLSIALRRPSRFLIEALETAIHQRGKNAARTGPYAPAPSPALGLQANHNYYLGRPAIERVTITPYPTVRTAWAELLRGNLDMLYEANIDALDSLQAATDVAVFSFVRHYQLMIVFGPRARALDSPDVRRELNAAIDRTAIVRDVLSGHGVPSTGPVPPHHWALQSSAPTLTMNSQLARRLAMRHLEFTCLVPSDSVYERIALAVKQQLAAASVDMHVEEAKQDQILQAVKTNNYDAVLVDAVSGPTIFRTFRLFSSKVQFSPKPKTSPAIDAALDEVRYAQSDVAYSDAVTAFQRAIVNEPPVLFLLWSQRARAVSRRFDVVVPDDGGDVLNTLRLWRSAGQKQVARTN